MKNEITTSIPTQYIKLNGITYEVTPVSLNKECKEILEFSDFLDKLDPDIFNKVNEEYGKLYDLNYFSTLFTKEYLYEHEINELRDCISKYKDIITYVIYDKIKNLLSIINVNNEFSINLELAMSLVEYCVNFAEDNHLTDIQEFINWEDDLNAYSIRDHAKYSNK